VLENGFLNSNALSLAGLGDFAQAVVSVGAGGGDVISDQDERGGEV
jgi:hypothetical protein